MKAGRLMEFESRREQPRDHADTVANVQFAAQHAPVESVGDLERHEMRGNASDVLGNPGLKGGVSLVRVILFNQPLNRQACIDDDGPAHAHPSVSASLILTGLSDQVGGTSRRGLPPNISCRSSANTSWSGLSDTVRPSRWLRLLSTPDQWQLGSTHAC